MTIRNTQTGETKQIDPSQASQYGITAPTQLSQPNQQPQGGNPLQSLASSFFPETTKTFTKGVQNIESYPPPKNLADVIPNAVGKTGKFAQTVFNPGQVGEVGLNALFSALGVPAGKILGKATGTAAKVVTNPSRAIGKMVENKVTSAGNPSEELLQKYLGTARDPHPDLYKKIGLSDTAPLKQTRQVLTNLLSSSGKDNISGNPSFLDILNARTGAYGSAKGSFLQPANTEQKLAKNLARAYTGIIHEGVPSTKMPDKLLSLLHTTNNPVAKYGLGGYLLNQLMHHVSTGVQSMFSGDGN